MHGKRILRENRGGEKLLLSPSVLPKNPFTAHSGLVYNYPMKRRQQVGRWGEQLAEQFLLERGCQLIERNARTPYGEIDRIVRQDGVTVFVEVKTRSSLAFGLPEESITARKREHLLNASQAYLQAHPELDGDWRVDVIAIQGRPGQKDPQIVWFENAVS